MSKSIDGGLTYPIRTVAATPLDQTGCICPPGNLISQGGGGLLGTNDKVGFVYATSTGGVNFARSTNGGATFTQSTVGPASNADTSQAFPVVADGGGGRLAAVWMPVEGGRSSVDLATSSDWGATWSAPQTIVSGGTSVYPWVAASGQKIAVSLYHTGGGQTFSALQSADPTSVKSGPICTAGTGCNGDRELLDFQSDTLDGAGLADLAYTRSIDGVADTQVRFVHEN